MPDTREPKSVEEPRPGRPEGGSEPQRAAAARRVNDARPSASIDEIAAEICERLASGESLRAICRDDHMPKARTVYLWIARDLHGFFQQYVRARETCARARRRRNGSPTTPVALGLRSQKESRF
jgi:hypothetical protein